jgi:type VI secretion system protein ImpJ
MKEKEEEYKLARVRWEVGQPLLPEHFLAQEGAFEAEMRLRATLTGLPSYGVASLRWNVGLLNEGIIAIQSLTAVTKDGLMLHVPGNAKMVNQFELDKAGKSEVTVYLHVLKEETDAKDIGLYREEKKIKRVIRQLRLSSDATVDDEVDESIKLARLRKEDKQWHLVKGWAPPMLLVGSHPLLRWLLDDLEEFLPGVQEQLGAHVVHDTLLHPSKRSHAYRVLSEVYHLQAMLDDLKSRAIYPHPFRLYEAMRRLYIEACAYVGEVPKGYLGKEPKGRLKPYDHGNPGEALAELFGLLERSLKPDFTQTTHERFKYEDGRFVLSPVPKDAETASELYLLIRRGQDGMSRSVDGLKLASPSRLSTVRRLALRGIPFEHVAQVEFAHALDQDIDWYRLKLKGHEEWLNVLREKSLAFYDTPEIGKDAWVSLFWRT